MEGFDYKLESDSARQRKFKVALRQKVFCRDLR